MHYRRWQRHSDPLVFVHEKKTKAEYANKTPEYKAWSAMRHRCLNHNNKSYHNYGGRGIAVCERWLDNFDAFIEDMGKRPSRRHQLDRIDNDGNYEPDNCRWATPSQQMNNVRYNDRITIEGQTKTAAQWCRHFGINRSTFGSRRERGWSDIDALTRPLVSHAAAKWRN